MDIKQNTPCLKNLLTPARPYQVRDRLVRSSHRMTNPRFVDDTSQILEKSCYEPLGHLDPIAPPQ